MNFLKFEAKLDDISSTVKKKKKKIQSDIDNDWSLISYFWQCLMNKIYFRKGETQMEAKIYFWNIPKNVFCFECYIY